MVPQQPHPFRRSGPLRVLQALEGEGLGLRGAQQDVEGEGCEHLPRHLAGDALVRLQGQVAVVVGKAAAAAGHRLLQVGGAELFPGVLLQEGRHLPQLAGHIVHRGPVGAVGHVEHEVGHVKILGQPPEGEQVGVAGQGGGQDEPGPGHQAPLRRPDEDLMVGAEGLGQALALGMAEEGPLRLGARQKAAEALAGVGGQPQRLEGLAGQKQADHGGPLRVGQRGDHGVHGLNGSHLGGSGGLPAGSQLELQVFGPVAGDQPFPGPVRVLVTQGLDPGPEGGDDVFHGKPRLG